MLTYLEFMLYGWEDVINVLSVVVASAWVTLLRSIGAKPVQNKPKN